MTKKRLLLIASFPVAIAVALGVLSILPSRPGVTKANFDRIEKGMTMVEVDEIFGGKRDWPDSTAQVGQAMCWRAKDESGAIVEFVDGCVVIKQWADSHETILDEIRRWLHVQ